MKFYDLKEARDYALMNAEDDNEIVEAEISREGSVTTYRALAGNWALMYDRIVSAPPPYTFTPHTKSRRVTRRQRLESLKV